MQCHDMACIWVLEYIPKYWRDFNVTKATYLQSEEKNMLKSYIIIKYAKV